MFSWCRAITMIATASPARASAAGYPRARIASGSPSTAQIDASETNRNEATRQPHTTAAGMSAQGVMRRNAPRPVATPLPPRNPRKTGQQLPTTARTAAAPAQPGSGPARLPIQVAT